MRTASDICLLCKKNKSSKRNSHIIPKFFGKGIFFETNPRHGVLIDKNGNQQKIQDIPKEDYLLCPTCEKSFGIIETYCSYKLERIGSPIYFMKYSKIKRNNREYYLCNDLNIKIFNLLIYSIIWRLSISNDKSFTSFHLTNQDEENLRLFLIDYIVDNQTELLVKAEQMTKLLQHSHCIFKPSKKLRPPNSMLSANSRTEWFHQIHLVDYILLYYTNSNMVYPDLIEIDNNSLESNVKIGLVEPKDWLEFNKKMLNEMMD